MAQPIDVDINWAFKQEYHRTYNKWFAEPSNKAKAGKTKVNVPLYHVVSGWALQAWQVIDSTLIKKTWVHITKQANKTLANKALEDRLAAALAMADLSVVGVSTEPTAVDARSPMVHDNEPRFQSKQGLTPDHDALQQDDVAANIISALSKPMGANKANLYGSLLLKCVTIKE